VRSRVGTRGRSAEITLRRGGRGGKNIGGWGDGRSGRISSSSSLFLKGLCDHRLEPVGPVLKGEIFGKTKVEVIEVDVG